MTSISKDVQDLKQKLFYIDRSVNPYFNKQITMLVKTVFELDNRIKDLEKKLNTTTELNNEQDNQNSEIDNESDYQNTNTTNVKNNKTNRKKNNEQKRTNDIRTITLDS